MLPRAAMLAIKFRNGRDAEQKLKAENRKQKFRRAPISAFSFLISALLLAGCTPPGPRALLEGKRLLEQGRYPQAVEKLTLATSLMATNAQAWNYLGLAHHRAGNADGAARAYKHALD